MKNILLALCCMAFAVACFLSTLGFPNPGVVYRSPAIYPQVIIAVIILLSLILIGAEVLGRASTKQEDDASPTSIRLPLLILAAITGYCLLMPLVGFVVSAFAFILVIYRLYGGSLVSGCIFAAGMTAAQHILFAVLLDVRVPDPLVTFLTRSFSI